MVHGLRCVFPPRTGGFREPGVALKGHRWGDLRAFRRRSYDDIFPCTGFYLHFQQVPAHWHSQPRGMWTARQEVGGVVSAWHPPASTRRFPGGGKPRQSFHWLRDRNDKSVHFIFFLLYFFSFQFHVDVRHRITRLLRDYGDATDMGYWDRVPVHREYSSSRGRRRRAVAQILTIHFPALHFCISVLLTVFAFHYTHPPSLEYQRKRRGIRLSLTVLWTCWNSRGRRQRIPSESIFSCQS